MVRQIWNGSVLGDAPAGAAGEAAGEAGDSAAAFIGVLGPWHLTQKRQER